MSAKTPAKNQTPLPKAVVIRARLAELGITEQDVVDSIEWARKGK